MIERKCADAGDAGGKRDTGQPFALKERPRSDAGDTVGDGNTRRPKVGEDTDPSIPTSNAGDGQPVDVVWNGHSPVWPAVTSNSASAVAIVAVTELALNLCRQCQRDGENCE